MEQPDIIISIIATDFEESRLIVNFQKFEQVIPYFFFRDYGVFRDDHCPRL
jgi:hypothetical protein